MKKNILILLIFVSFSFCPQLTAQVMHGGQPYSFRFNLPSNIASITMPSFDIDSLKREDGLEDKIVPFRFGKSFSLSLNLNNSGTWHQLENGDRIWRLKIISNGAYTINLIFDMFMLPPGGELFIYNSDKSTVIGSFTSKNNQSHGKFATTLVRGNTITLEYFEPIYAMNKSILQISNVIHGYRDVYSYLQTSGGLEKSNGFRDSESCNNNVYCPESNGWEDEIHSVGMILVDNGTRWCSGGMLNNVENNYKPYFLTANHCLTGDLDSWLIWFNYESSTCQNPSTEPTPDVTNPGVTLRASNSATDFALVELNSKPPTSFGVHYAGWYRANIAANSSVGIHHPSSDIKKISYEYDQAVSTNWPGTPSNSHWRIYFDDGTVEHGSSGSPLFNPNHKVVGQLHGNLDYAGGSYCAVPRGWYGKFSMSWDYGSTKSTRLKDWMDPNNTGITEINSLPPLLVPQEYSTIASAINAAAAGMSVLVSSGTYGENITMKSGVNVIGSGSVTIAGSVTFNGATNCELRGVYVSNYSPATTTITINNGSASTTKLVNVRSRNRIAINNGGAYLSNVNCYQYDNNYGVDMYNAGPAMAGFTSTTSMTDPSDPAALYIHNGSSPTLYGTIRNKYRGVYLTTSSYATMHGTSFCQNAWDIYSTSAWDSDAYNSMTFSASTAAECVYGDVNLPDPGDWDWCGVAKVAATTDTLHHPVLLLPVEPVTGDAYAQSVTRYHNHRRNLLNRLQQDGAVDSAETAQGYGDLIADFAAFIQAHPADPRAAQALVYLKTSAFEGGQPEAVKTLVTDLLTDATSRPLHPELLNTLFAYYQWVQDGPQALATADRFLATYPASDLAPEVIYGKGLVYKYLLQDATGADAQFAQVIAGYPEHPVTHSALAEAQQTAEGTVAKLAMDTGQTHPWNATVVVAPNPYDIQQQTQSLQFFHLPVYARIQLYDVAGRHRLTTASQGANAALTLSAQDYPAGVYLYVVEELDGADGAPTGKRTTGKFVIIQ